MQNDCCAGHSRVVGKFYLITVHTLILYAWPLVWRSVDLEAFSEISGGIRAGRGAVSDPGSRVRAQKVNTGRDRRDAVPRDLSLLKALGGHLSFNPSSTSLTAAWNQTLTDQSMGHVSVTTSYPCQGQMFNLGEAPSPHVLKYKQ